MKKGIFKGLVIAGLVATAPMAFSGCGKKPTISEYEVSGHTTIYYLNESFSIVGTTLKLIMSDGSVKEVTVTAEMIKSMPDMSTEGTKEIVIVYEGKEYVYTIQVAKRILTKEEKVAKLKEALTRYLISNKTDGITAKYNLDMVARYLQDTAQYDNVTDSIVLDDATVAEIKELKPAYDKLLKLLLQSSLNVEKDDVLDGEDIKTKLNVLNTFANLTSDINTPEKALNTIYDYINKNIFYEADYKYVNSLTDELCSLFAITSDQGKTEIKYIVTDLFSNFRNKQQPDFYNLVVDLNDVVMQYSELDLQIKSNLNAAVSLLDLNDHHALSAYIRELSPLITVWDYHLGGERTDLRNLAESYVEKVADAVYVLEDVFTAEDYTEFVTQLKTKVKAIVDLNAQLTSEDVHLLYYTTGRAAHSADLIQMIYDVLTLMENSSKQAVLEAIMSYDWISFIPEDFMVEITQDSYEMVLGLIYDAINGNTIDFDKFIVDFAAEYGFDGQKYLDQFEADHKTTLVQDVWDKYIDLQDAPQQAIDFFGTLRDICVYVDNLPAKSAFVPEDIAEELLTLIRTSAESGLTWAQSDEQNGEPFEQTAQSVLNYLDMADDVVAFVKSENQQAAIDIVLAYDLLSLIPESFPIEISEDSYKMVIGLLYDVINQNEVDYKQFIIDFAAEYDFDGQKYFDEFEQTGKTTLLQDIWDKYVDTSSMPNITQEEVAMYDSLRDVCVYIDNISAKEEYLPEEIIVEVLDLVNGFATTSNAHLNNILPGDPAVEITRLLSVLTDTSLNDPLKMTAGLVEEYRTEVEQIVTEYTAYALMIEKETEGYNVLSNVVTKHVDKFVNDTFDYAELIEDASNVINNYSTDSIKILTHSAMMLACVSMYDENIDYNEVFDFVELPNMVESVDYNVLMKKLANPDTYAEMLTFRDVEVEHVFDDNGNLVKEIFTVEFKLDFDAMITSIDANLVLTLEVDM